MSIANRGVCLKVHFSVAFFNQLPSPSLAQLSDEFFKYFHGLSQRRFLIILADRFILFLLFKLVNLVRQLGDRGNDERIERLYLRRIYRNANSTCNEGIIKRAQSDNSVNCSPVFGWTQKGDFSK